MTLNAPAINTFLITTGHKETEGTYIPILFSWKGTSLQSLLNATF